MIWIKTKGQLEAFCLDRNRKKYCCWKKCFSQYLMCQVLFKMVILIFELMWDKLWLSFLNDNFEDLVILTKNKSYTSNQVCTIKYVKETDYLFYLNILYYFSMHLQFSSIFQVGELKVWRANKFAVFLIFNIFNIVFL